MGSAVVATADQQPARAPRWFARWAKLMGEDHWLTDPRFKDECELLRPILAGAGILYVVDGAHPYGAEYEAEMEALKGSGCMS